VYEKLNGTSIAGLFCTRWLKEFILREGTKLAQEQAELIRQIANHNSQSEVEQESDSEIQGDNEDMGKTSGDEDATTGEEGSRDYSMISHDLSGD
jgi:hypothetical protein